MGIKSKAKLALFLLLPAFILQSHFMAFFITRNTTDFFGEE